MIRLLVLLTGLIVSSVVVATDVGKEKRWVEQVEANLFDGEMIWLDAAGHSFLGVLIESEMPKGVVVLAHGTGVHPNWPQVTNPLRVALAEMGWTTLSIQMPVLHNEIGHDDYAPVFPEAWPRFKAAADYFSGQKPLVLHGFSLGSSMSTWYLKHHTDHPYDAFIGIGMGGNSDSESTFQEADNVESLKSVTVPVLDLYGENDFSGILASAAGRADSQKHNSAYTQVMAKSANHFFDGQDDQLIKIVSNWLNEMVK
ncbi:MAG: pimeloyl-ACP methyl ester carboxylesterase [Parasphingorhabdus sp.]|jgi:pimeloyl-ACP methyl ester carboxylesterase